MVRLVILERSASVKKQPLALTKLIFVGSPYTLMMPSALRLQLKNEPDQLPSLST